MASLKGVNPLARCNALASYLEHHEPKEESQIISLLLEIAQNFDRIDYLSLLTVINEDRQIAKIPLIQDIDSIKEEIQNRGEYITGVMKNSLNFVKAPDNVLTEIINKTISNGKQDPPKLIEELTDKYQIEVQNYLDQLADQIRNIITNIQEEPKKAFKYQMPTLTKYLKAWDQIAQPIQLVQQSKGMDDPHSKELAGYLRDLALGLNNSHGMYSEAGQLVSLATEIFKELPQFAEKFSDDLKVYVDNAMRKAQSKGEENQWRAECSMDVEFGTIFKKRLTITSELIRFKNEQIPTNEVTQVRWGATVTKDTINHITTGVTYSYSIWIGSYQKTIYIEPSDENLYNTIVDRLWKTVCVRLLTDTLKRLSEGEIIQFGNDMVTVSKEGVFLHKFVNKGGVIFKKVVQEASLYKWEDLAISNGNGTFIVESSADKNIRAELSYRDVNNVHILEAVMRFLWKDGNYQKLRRGEFSEG